MAKAVFSKPFNATDPRKGVSLRIHASEAPQNYPEWAVSLAVEAGAAERIKPKRTAVAGKSTEKGN